MGETHRDRLGLGQGNWWVAPTLPRSLGPSSPVGALISTHPGASGGVSARRRASPRRSSSPLAVVSIQDTAPTQPMVGTGLAAGIDLVFEASSHRVGWFTPRRFRPLQPSGRLTRSTACPGPAPAQRVTEGAGTQAGGPSQVLSNPLTQGRVIVDVHHPVPIDVAEDRGLGPTVARDLVADRGPYPGR